MVQKGTHRGWGKCGQKDYLISALTRGKFKTVLLTIGYKMHAID